MLDAATTTGATTGPVDTDWTLEETDEEGVPLSMVADVSQVAEQLGRELAETGVEFHVANCGEEVSGLVFFWEEEMSQGWDCFNFNVHN